MKKVSTVMLIVSIITAVLGLVLPSVLFSSPDIIGGAGIPSMRFYMRTLPGQVCCMCLLFGAAGVLCWGVSLLMHRASSLSDTALALGVSAAAALGLDCMLMFAGCFVMTHPERHPIALPVSIIGGCAAAVLLWLFISRLIRSLKASKNAKSMLVCTLAFTLHLIPFMYLTDFGYELTKTVLK